MSFEVSIEAEPGRTVTATLSASNPLLIVGRSKSADLTTANRTVSREHAELRLERGAVALRDLDSVGSGSTLEQPGYGGRIAATDGRHQDGLARGPSGVHVASARE